MREEYEAFAMSLNLHHDETAACGVANAEVLYLFIWQGAAPELAVS